MAKTQVCSLQLHRKDFILIDLDTDRKIKLRVFI